MKKIAACLAIFLSGTLLGGLIVWIYGGFLYRDWSFSWQWSVAGQPLATFCAGIAAIIAARIAFYNGQKTRKQDKEIHEAKSRAEQERTLRERFTSIVEMLSTTNSEDYTKRESGAYALAALADDWAVFHEYDPESARQEQQVCLNILTSQLRDPISKKSPPQLLTFKKRVQTIIFSRFKDQENKSPRTWSKLELDLSNCHFYNLVTNGHFKDKTYFSDAKFYGMTNFRGSKFDKEIHFEKTEFHDYVCFSDTIFSQSTYFSNSSFLGMANFTRSHFRKKAYFNEASFNSTLFQHATFYYIALFHKASFKEVSYFKSAIFRNEAHFDRSSFLTTPIFNNAHFFDLIFEDVKLPDHGASFGGVKFCKTESNPHIIELKKKLREYGIELTSIAQFGKELPEIKED